MGIRRLDWLDDLVEAEKKSGQKSCTTCQYGALGCNKKPCISCISLSRKKNNTELYKFWQKEEVNHV